MAGAALFAGAAGDAAAYSVKQTKHGDLVHWDAPTVSYTIDASMPRSVTRAAEATETALSAWSGSVGAPELEIAAHGEGSPTAPGFDEKNGIFFVRGGYAPAGRALAITVLTYDNRSGRILDADIVFNGTYSFEVLDEDAPLVAAAGARPTTATDAISHDQHTDTITAHELVFDMHHVIAHEIGHTLGMNDEFHRTDALMYRYSAPNDPSIREPAADDIEGLAQIYSKNIEGTGSGCASATVAPKAPSRPASRAATFAALSLLLFLLVRGRSDARARGAFVAGAVVAAIAFVPSLTGKGGPAVAHANEASVAIGHARAKVLRSQTAIERGLFKTTYELVTTECRAARCPTSAVGAAWGGTIGHLTQEVGGYYAPLDGDAVDVSFAALPSALRPLSSPLAGRGGAEEAGAVAVLTRAE